MFIGYARVSKEEQNLDVQLDALRRAGCEMIFQEKASGGDNDRPELAKVFDIIKRGDVLLVWKMDRLSRDSLHQQQCVEMVRQEGALIKCLAEDLDVESSSGRLQFQMKANFSEYERALISERTKAKLAYLKSQGRELGPPRKFPRELAAQVVEAYNNGGGGYGALAKRFGISKGYVQKIINTGERR